MLIAYYSVTGNVRRFAHKLGRPSSLYEITDPNAVMHEPYVLVTPTTGFGQVPPRVAEFVRNNSEYLRGVAASGSVNWGVNFAAAGRTIADAYAVPLIHTFELSGMDEDVRIFNERMTQIVEETAWEPRA